MNNNNNKQSLRKIEDIHYSFKIFAHTIWGERELPDLLKPKAKRILFLQIIYAAFVVFACTLSFLALINPGQAWRHNWQEMMKIFQISGLCIFIFDYIAHWITYSYIASYKKGYKYEHKIAWLKYLISGPAVIAFLCIVSSLNVISYFTPENSQEKEGLKYLSALNIIKVFRLFLVLKLITPFKVILNVFSRQRKVLIYVFTIILFLIVIFALLIYNNETQWLNQQQELWKAKNNVENPEQNPEYIALGNNVVKNIFEAIYFATITLTTIGYGDFVPHSVNARVIVIIISLLGIAIIAIPSGLIAGAFMADLKNRKLDEKREKIPACEEEYRKKLESKNNEPNEADSQEDN
ncbi:potassium channel family protein [Metamycoplasma spumans]|uniref:potassium channel family protein n=1 Tax=Metamycoplasma spumans TaxID=92406 RepID=UPI0034DD0B71